MESLGDRTDTLTRGAGTRCPAGRAMASTCEAGDDFGVGPGWVAESAGHFSDGRFDAGRFRRAVVRRDHRQDRCGELTTLAVLVKPCGDLTSETFVIGDDEVGTMVKRGGENMLVFRVDQRGAVVPDRNRRSWPSTTVRTESNRFVMRPDDSGSGRLALAFRAASSRIVAVATGRATIFSDTMVRMKSHTRIGYSTSASSTSSAPLTGFGSVILVGAYRLPRQSSKKPSASASAANSSRA